MQPFWRKKGKHENKKIRGKTEKNTCGDITYGSLWRHQCIHSWKNITYANFEQKVDIS